VHAVDPFENEYEPAAHNAHTEPLGAENEPAVHATQTLAFDELEYPAAQGEHTDRPLEFEKYPAEHTTHSVKPDVFANDPKAHEVQVDEPVPEEKVPTAHAAQYGCGVPGNPNPSVPGSKDVAVPLGVVVTEKCEASDNVTTNGDNDDPSVAIVDELDTAEFRKASLPLLP